MLYPLHIPSYVMFLMDNLSMMMKIVIFGLSLGYTHFSTHFKILISMNIIYNILVLLSYNLFFSLIYLFFFLSFGLFLHKYVAQLVQALDVNLRPCV